MKILEVPLTFHPAALDPIGEPFSTDDYLIYNKCDGFHIVFGYFDDDGFQGFRDFLGVTTYRRDFYEAWAKLPDCTAVLYPIFGRPPLSQHPIRRRSE